MTSAGITGEMTATMTGGIQDNGDGTSNSVVTVGNDGVVTVTEAMADKLNGKVVTTFENGLELTSTIVDGVMTTVVTKEAIVPGTPELPNPEKPTIKPGETGNGSQSMALSAEEFLKSKGWRETTFGWGWIDADGGFPTANEIDKFLKANGYPGYEDMKANPNASVPIKTTNNGSTNTTDKSGAKQIPQTGYEESKLAVVGASMLGAVSFGGVLALLKRKREKPSK